MGRKRISMEGFLEEVKLKQRSNELKLRGAAGGGAFGKSGR